MAEFDYNTGQKTEFWLLEIADTQKYYNAKHQIIRVMYGGKYYDVKCYPGHIVPNRRDHLVICVLPEGFFTSNDGLTEQSLKYEPGIISSTGTLGSLSNGIAFLTPKKQVISTTNPQSAGSSFAISDVNMFDQENVCISITPPIVHMDYTKQEDPSIGDLNNQNVGLFINRQGTILIKSINGSITIGKEGVHIGGKFKADASVKDTGIITENPLSKLIPSSIPTAWANFSIPNIGAIASIANAALKFMEITSKTTKVIDIISNIK